MATGYLSSGTTIYSRPTSSASIGTSVSGKTVTILFEESGYYFVDIPAGAFSGAFSGKKMQGYVLKTKLTGIAGSGIRTYTFKTSNPRYLGDEVTAWYGPGAAYGEAPAPIFPQQVTFGGDYDTSNPPAYAFIQYTVNGATVRAWVDRTKLVVNQLFPWKYIPGQPINNKGDKWFTGGNMWNSSQIHLGHTGIDMQRMNSTGIKIENRPVYAIATGTVKAASGDESANGKCVIIEHSTAGGKRYYSYYCHLNSISVNVGDRISVRGQAIGIMGNTNGNTGDMIEHVHISITRDNVGVRFYGYNRDVNGNYESMTPTGGVTPDFYDMNCQYPNMNTRYYNPTAYFTQGESLIDNNYN